MEVVFGFPFDGQITLEDAAHKFDSGDIDKKCARHTPFECVSGVCEVGSRHSIVGRHARGQQRFYFAIDMMFCLGNRPTGCESAVHTCIPRLSACFISATKIRRVLTTRIENDAKQGQLQGSS